MKRGRDDEGEVDMANCLMLLTKVGESCKTNALNGYGGGFKCKTCNREFLSFQALGGHRASHKKLKLMGQLPSTAITIKPKIHLCPICGLEFSIGQALGGHMRKHRATLNDDLLNDNDTKRFNLCLDLNLTPSQNDLKLGLRNPVLNCFI